MGVPSFVQPRLPPSATVLRPKVVEGARPSARRGNRPAPRDNSARGSPPQEHRGWTGAGGGGAPAPTPLPALGSVRAARPTPPVPVGPTRFQPLLPPSSAPPEPSPGPLPPPPRTAPPRFKPQRREGCVSPPGPRSRRGRDSGSQRALTSWTAGDAARTGRPTSAATRE